MQTEDQSLTPNPFWKAVLVALPLCLILTGGGAMWVWWSDSRESAPDPRLALAAGEVGEGELQDHLHKIDDLIGGRDWVSSAGRSGMRRMVAFLEGTLSPQNYGFAVQKGAYRSRGGELWPILWVDLPGRERAGEVVVVAAPYDRAAGPVAMVLGVINDLRDEPTSRTVRFAFYPAGLEDGGNGGEPRGIMKKEESLVETILPVQPQSDHRQGASELVPPARELLEKVRELAR